MNKLTKIGASALCGSLAAISAANAGDLTATGSAGITWMSNEDSTTGNPIGMVSAVSFTGSGELDNGWGVTLSIAHNDKNAYSNSYINIALPGVGDVRIDQGVSGTGIHRMDDMTPTVWEEADGAGLSATINKISGVSAGTNIEVTPTELMPDGLTARIAFAKDADSGQANDKATGGVSGMAGSGYDITLQANSDLLGVDGLDIYVGMSEVEQYQNAGSVSGDRSERVYGIKYAAGGFTLGYQQTDEETGLTSGTDYENTAYGITFNVNDDLSIGYNFTESDEKGQGNPTAEAMSIQAAYTMGGATISIAEVEVDNQAYSTAASADLSSTIVKLGLAF
jgi:outer membrane protein OmpU